MLLSIWQTGSILCSQSVMVRQITPGDDFRRARLRRIYTRYAHRRSAGYDCFRFSLCLVGAEPRLLMNTEEVPEARCLPRRLTGGHAEIFEARTPTSTTGGSQESEGQSSGRRCTGKVCESASHCQACSRTGRQLRALLDSGQLLGLSETATEVHIAPSEGEERLPSSTYRRACGSKEVEVHSISKSTVFCWKFCSVRLEVMRCASPGEVLIDFSRRLQ